MKRIMLVLIAALFLAVPAFAGNTPTFDAVGNDAANFFAAQDFIKQLVVAGNLDTFGNQVEAASDFTPFKFGTVKWEKFASNGALQADPCFPGYTSYMAGPGRTVNYTWRILLQYQPESDLNINILDCVLKHNERNPFLYADQTGYYRSGDAALAFKLDANPKITVKAFAGVNSAASPNTELGILNARVMPSLRSLPLDAVFYTTKAFWEEALVAELPSLGEGTGFYELVAGDMIEVKVVVPYKTVADVYYGRDNVIIKYIGMVYTDLNTVKDAALLADFD